MFFVNCFYRAKYSSQIPKYRYTHGKTWRDVCVFNQLWIIGKKNVMTIKRISWDFFWNQIRVEHNKTGSYFCFAIKSGKNRFPQYFLPQIKIKIKIKHTSLSSKPCTFNSSIPSFPPKKLSKNARPLTPQPQKKTTWDMKIWFQCQRLIQNPILHAQGGWGQQQGGKKPLIKLQPRKTKEWQWKKNIWMKMYVSLSLNIRWWCFS